MSAVGWPLPMMNLDALNDEDLLRLALAGDEAAFTALYRRRQPSVYRFALQMSGSRALAEDVTQEVFLTLVRDGQRFDPERGRLLAFLFGVARHHVLRRLARERSFIQMAESEDESAASVGLIAEGDPLSELTRGEMIARVRAAVLALPPHYREAVVLCDLHEMSYAEAAEVIGCAIGTVRSRLHRARLMLIEKLRGTQDEAASRAVNPTGCFA
ncbi:MAG TPA: RNA polymerase sigma factor [Blastocatellia bacterium]|nr:RNA polymerase sigma factor [Blastocatellia bacterium]